MNRVLHFIPAKNDTYSIITTPTLYRTHLHETEESIFFGSNYSSAITCILHETMLKKKYDYTFRENHIGHPQHQQFTLNLKKAQRPVAIKYLAETSQARGWNFYSSIITRTRIAANFLIFFTVYQIQTQGISISTYLHCFFAQNMEE